jgi:hypothetical protein
MQEGEKVLYIEANIQKMRERIDIIDSIPELMRYVDNIRQLQKHRLDYETSRLLKQSVTYVKQRMDALTTMATGHI